MRRRTWWCGFPTRLTLLIGVVLGLAAGMLVGPAHPAAGPAGHPGAGAVSASSTSSPATRAGAAPSAKAQPAPLDHDSANVRHAPPGQPLAETARAFGSSTLSADSAAGSDQPAFPSLTWFSRSSGAVRQVLDAVAPRLGRAPPPSRVS